MASCITGGRPCLGEFRLLTAAQTDSRRAAAAVSRWKNWSGSQTASPSRWATPATEAELAVIVQQSAQIRVVGAGHSFTPLVPTGGCIVSLDRLTGLADHHRASHQATLWAGTRLFECGPLLHAVGQALPNMGDIDRQSIGGVLSTATHGTGTAFPCMAAGALELRLVTASGEVLTSSAERDSDIFHAAAVSLGALGVISRVTLQNVPSFRLRERVEMLPLDAVLADLDRWKRLHRNFELWVFPHSRQALIKTLDLTDDAVDSQARGADAADGLLRLCSELTRALPGLAAPLQKLAARFIKPTLRVGDSWRIYPSERDVRFNEMEYHVPDQAGAEALDEACRVSVSSGTAGFFPIEFRFVAGDAHWLSPFEGGNRASIAVHQYYKQDYRPLFAAVEPILRRRGGRPHWGKLHTATHRDLLQMYPNFARFLRIRAQLDPEGKFLNPYLRSIFGLADA
jgi:FAD-linked oxidoreductase